MRLNLARVRTLLFEVPRTGTLAYGRRGARRVPRGPKVAAGVAVGLVVSPLDVPAWIPVIGDLDMLALGILAVKVFVDARPARGVEAHRAALDVGESAFDRDLGFAVAVVREGARSLVARSGARPALRESRESEDDPT